MTPTHEQVLAAIARARVEGINVGRWVSHDHCNDLRAVAERHAPRTGTVFDGGEWTWVSCGQGHPDWPCPDYQLVIDRLQAWGYLTERTDR